MKAPTELQSLEEDREDVTIARRETDGHSEIVADLGAGASESSVDVVGDTAIVVLDETQCEFDVPASATEVTVTNGILTMRSDPSGE